MKISSALAIIVSAAAGCSAFVVPKPTIVQRTVRPSGQNVQVSLPSPAYQMSSCTRVRSHV